MEHGYCKSFNECLEHYKLFETLEEELDEYIVKKYQCTVCGRRWEKRWKYIGTTDSRSGDSLAW